jgi:hypothetical protein
LESRAYCGEVDKAIGRLERAFRQRDADMTDLKTDVLLANLHGDARYKALLVKTHLRPRSLEPS